MDDSKKSGNGAPAAGGPAEATPLQIHVIGQYIKDLSFENPDLANLLKGPGESPNMNLEINVNARHVGEDVFESVTDFRAHATNQAGTIYLLEVKYGGLFRIQNAPEQAMEPILLVNCPALLFPFLRRLVADLTRESGFPPLYLDPVDFASMFVGRQKQLLAEAAAKPKN